MTTSITPKTKTKSKSAAHLHLHLVSRVTANHVLDSQRASGVCLEPAVQTQDAVLEDDNRLSIGNPVDNRLPRHGLIAGGDAGHDGSFFCVWKEMRSVDANKTCEGFVKDAIVACSGYGRRSVEARYGTGLCLREASTASLYGCLIVRE